MPKVLSSQVYINVVQLPYANHALAKELLNKVKEEKTTKVKCDRKKFGKSKRATLRGLFIFAASQLPWYCPADEIKVKFGKGTVIVNYKPQRQYYKGVEEL